MNWFTQPLNQFITPPLTFIDKLPCREFIRLLLLASRFFQLVCLLRPCCKGIERDALALAALPCAALRAHAPLRILNDFLLSVDRLIQLVQKQLVIAVTGNGQARLHVALETGYVIVPILEQQLQLLFGFFADADRPSKPFRGFIGFLGRQVDQRIECG